MAVISHVAVCDDTTSAWAEVGAKCRKDTFFKHGLTSEHNCVVLGLQCEIWVSFVSEDITGI